MSEIKTKVRPEFECCNCGETFAYPVDTSGKKQMIVVCPYCAAECSVNLNGFVVGTQDILRDGHKVSVNQYDFSEVIHTAKQDS